MFLIMLCFQRFALLFAPIALNLLSNVYLGILKALYVFFFRSFAFLLHCLSPCFRLYAYSFSFCFRVRFLTRIDCYVFTSCS